MNYIFKLGKFAIFVIFLGGWRSFHRCHIYVTDFEWFTIFSTLCLGWSLLVCAIYSILICSKKARQICEKGIYNVAGEIIFSIL